MRSVFFGSLIFLVSSASRVCSDEPRSARPGATLGAPIASDAGETPPASEKVAAPKYVPGPSSVGQGGSRFWGSAEYLHWWIRDGNTPPLATTGTPASNGILGNPGTAVLFGGDLDYGNLPGARFTFGTWLGCNGTLGVGLSYFFLDGNQSFGASSSGAAGSALLARPFFNVIPGQQDAELVAFPGFARGGIRITSNSSFQGADLNLFYNPCCQPSCPPTDCSTDCASDCSRGVSYRLDLFAGPRWLQLNEDLVIAEEIAVAPATFAIVDRFETRNNFFGGQIGARAEWQKGNCFVNLLGKVAIGNTHQEVRISGATVVTVPGAAPLVQQGGLLALPTNIGSYSRDVFSVVPEIGVNVGCQLTRRLRAFAGYSFLYWSNVVRPGDQIDFGINPTQLPTAVGPGTLVGPARPSFAFRETDFWAHGINLGLEYRW